MELVKIGDKVYNERYHSWTKTVSYRLATIERLTKTQAILSDGTKLINEPTKGYDSNQIEYPQYGDR